MRLKSLLLVMLIPALAQAADQNTTVTDASRTDTSQHTQSATQSLQQQAGRWGLSEEDWGRYQELMAGPRGIQSPGLDPLTALGIEARTPAERRAYAEKWVKEEHARTEKELAFQREVDAAWQRLYPEKLPVSMGNAGVLAGDTGGRLALFVKAKDCASCDIRLSKVLASGKPVDIYLVDSQGKDGLLRQWAREHNIPPEKVRSRHITLNHDAGRWLRFGEGQIPVVLQQGADGWRVAAF
ncbi:TIGR03759 family integrating conjugative element protein [Escherichia sp. E2586]|uniref:TIGR03759 family integrating conjugative element protein n=1 Tax=Escherichia sp. E2586 TaxID=2044457 RepID=UPI0010801CCF|nr:TIGR03759 family integrating conjugative element protein [Escherichia sp. E2586]TGB98976.1 TIGR03759 family integrating conjugative element protein [Escherichia sp. E2586]TLI64924.1 TIGR03759 family integrating conjugative element protein [Escherichia sp. E2586]